MKSDPIVIFFIKNILYKKQSELNADGFFYYLFFISVFVAFIKIYFGLIFLFNQAEKSGSTGYFFYVLYLVL